MQEPLPLSLVVITRDAGEDIAACIASAPFVADVIVVDSGSRDDTVARATAAGARVVHRDFDGFGPQKAFAVGEARHDWVLCLDADERVTDELGGSIRSLFAAGPPRAAAYELVRRNRFLGRWLAHGEGYPDRVVRMFDRRRAGWSDDPVHESVRCAEPPGRLQGDLMHASAESIEAYVAKQNRYTTLQAQALHARGERAGLARMALAPAVRFLRYYVLRGGFLDGAAGFAHGAIGAFSSFLKYVKLAALDEGRR